VITADGTKGNYGFIISAVILLKLIMNIDPLWPKELNTIVT
jgi:hypothetical protein